MLDRNSNLEIAKEIMVKSRDYEAVVSLMDVDSDLGIPKDGEANRNRSRGIFIEARAELFKSREAAGAAAGLADLDVALLKNPSERALVRAFLHRYKYVADVPSRQIAQLNELTGKAMMAWKEARNQSNYGLLSPYLKEIFERKTEIAQCIDKNKNPLDVLMNEDEEYLPLETVDGLLSTLKAEVLELSGKIRKKQKKIDSEFLYAPIDSGKNEQICTDIVRKMGFDTNRGKIYNSTYSRCLPVGPRDVRLNCDFHNFYTGMFALLHEAGHGIYTYSSDESAIEFGLHGGQRGGFHEGQARLFENIVGRSRWFWKSFYQGIQKELPLYKNVEFEDFYRAINKIEPTPIRVDADELNYNLHIILRFEMEKEYFDHKISVEDFPEVMSQKYKQYLGIEPAGHGEGVLQDIHWSMGYIGYFQTYAIGNLYGGQLYQAMLQAEPGVMEDMAEGDFGTFQRWQQENIYQYGRIDTPGEVVQRVTGKGIDTKDLITYFKEKYTDLYELA